MTTDTEGENQAMQNIEIPEKVDDWPVDPEDIKFAEKTTAVPAATFQEPETVADAGWGDDANLLPDGAGGKGNDEWDTEGEEIIDLSDLRINLSKEEAAAETFPDLVAGKYRVAIFKIVVQKSKSEKNFGKPMYNVTYKVQDGVHKGAQIFGDFLCLWSGAAYNYVMLLKALGYQFAEGSIKVVPPGELIGKTLIVRLGMGRANTIVKDGVTTTYAAKLQVKGYFPDKNATTQGNVTQLDPLAP